VMDTGKTHVKFQPAIIGYQYLPIIESEKNIKDSKLQEVVTCCKDKILEVKPKRIVFNGDPDEVLCSKCVEISEAKTKHDYDKSSFIVSVESHGNMENEQLLISAADILTEKTNEFKKALKEL
ncbi:MAG: hypothetical protein Q7K42_01765, partial [Candidatus Diapherotrites archaeon]|nr:hypothetical protein [Candidatus Diapherotrites archaeon]